MIFVMGYLQVRDTDVKRLQPPIARQVAATRSEAGCEHYALANDIIDPAVIIVGERWRDQAALGAHLVSDHMVQFNLDMRAAKVLSARLDSYHPDGSIRKLLDIGAPASRSGKENKMLVIVMGTAKFAPGEIDRLHGELATQIAATRAEDGCEHYAFARDVIDPDLLHISERWRDNVALAAHTAAPHTAFNNALATAKVAALTVKAYDANGVRTLMGA